MDTAWRAAGVVLGCIGLFALSACAVPQGAGGGSGSALTTAAEAPVALGVAMGTGSQTQETIAPAPPASAERYAPSVDADFVAAAEQPYSTFAADVDTAAYARVRRYLRDGTLPPADLIRIEEMVNYFAYDYPTPPDRYHPLAISTALAPAPWNGRSQILRVGIQGFHEQDVLRPPLNLVFLVDVSGSMDSPDRLPLLQRGLTELIDVLRPVDRVALVTYASGVEIVLDPTAGDRQSEIANAVQALRAGGSTNGAGGLEAAYDLAADNFDPKAVNRVILVTDGDFNVGSSSPQEIGDMVATRRDLGIYMTVLGVGTGNLNDAIMQAIAQRGDGIAAYVDSETELRRALSESTAHTLFPIADDVKIQVTFNPATVAEYRLLGYETRAITREQFLDDGADGGDVSAGHSVTAIYEIVPALNIAAFDPAVRPAAYAPTEGAWAPDGIAEVEVRYQRPRSDSVERTTAQVSAFDGTSSIAGSDADTRFAAAVVGFALLLRDDPAMLRGFDYSAVIDLAAGALGSDALGMRGEFLELVRAASRL